MAKYKCVFLFHGSQILKLMRNRHNFSIGFLRVAKNVVDSLRNLLSYLLYSHISLNLLTDDHQFGYITNFGKKQKTKKNPGVVAEGKSTHNCPSRFYLPERASTSLFDLFPESQSFRNCPGDQAWPFTSISLFGERTTKVTSTAVGFLNLNLKYNII
jgi:hypothetical protein